MAKPDHNAVVAKDNLLIEKMANFELSELRLIAYCLAHYDSRNKENRVFTARVADLTELFPINKKYAYDVVKKAMLGINKRPLMFRQGNKEYFWNWFSGFVYDHDMGEFEFRITPEIQPYLLDLKKTFTRYRLKDVYQFKAASTWKMYENLKRHQEMNQWAVSLDELRLLMGVVDKYPRWNSFHERIINPSIKEINKVSDLAVTFEKNKRGKSIVGLVFFIDSKQPEEVITIENPAEALFKMLLKHGVSQKVARNYRDKAVTRGKTEYVLKLVPEIVARWEKKKNGTKQAYLLGALKDELDQMRLFDDNDQSSKKNVDLNGFSIEELEVLVDSSGHERTAEIERILKQKRKEAGR